MIIKQKLFSIEFVKRNSAVYKEDNHVSLVLRIGVQKMDHISSFWLQDMKEVIEKAQKALLGPEFEEEEKDFGYRFVNITLMQTEKNRAEIKNALKQQRITELNESIRTLCALREEIIKEKT